MASVIKLKRSSTPGAVPAGGDLEVGEVAVNLADRVIFAKQAGGSVVRIGESALANTNARINLLNTNLTGTNTALRTLVTAESARIDLVNTNLTATNSAIRTLITGNSNDITALGSRVDLVNTNLTATNTAIRLLNTNTQNALDTQEAKQASDLANTNTRLTALEGGSSGALSDRIDLVNTNLTGTNTALRTLITNNSNDITAVGGRVDLVNTTLTGTNTAIRTLVTAESARIDLVNTNLTSTNSAIRTLVTAAQGAGDQALADVQSTNTAIRSLITSNDTDIATLTSRVDLVNTNLTATNTAIRLLNTNTQSALDTQEAKQASNLANTNSFIKAQLANTNTRINNLSTSLSGDFMTKANPESNGHHAHTGRMSVSTNLLVSGNTHIDGNLTVEGEVTYISTTTLEVMDPLIKLASNNQTDVVDTGFYALYDEGSTAKYAGIFRDASDGIFKVFSGLQADPTVTVDTTGTGYALAQLDANIDGGSF